MLSKSVTFSFEFSHAVKSLCEFFTHDIYEMRKKPVQQLSHADSED